MDRELGEFQGKPMRKMKKRRQALKLRRSKKMNTEDTSDFIKKEIKEEYDDLNPLRCWECNKNFKSKEFLYKHLYQHIKQPQVRLERIPLPSLRLTIKSSNDGFSVVNSPADQSRISPTNLEENHEKQQPEEEDEEKDTADAVIEEQEENEQSSSNKDVSEPDPEVNSENESEIRTCSPMEIINTENMEEESVVVPGAEPTPPPESTSEFPKIRIKSNGLLKGTSLTLTEITDDNPMGGESNEEEKSTSENNSIWESSHSMDPIKTADENIMSIFNNTERAKDLGFCSSDSEFMPLDRLEERNRNSMQLYNPPCSSSQGTASTALDSLTGLPMQALAQQVSRLQPSANGMHQQNVLINIQQFPSGPPPPQYQPPPPPMYPHHPQQPMYHPPYPYQPPNPMFYPGPGYPSPGPQHIRNQTPHMGGGPMRHPHPPSTQHQSTVQRQTIGGQRPRMPMNPNRTQMAQQRQPMQPTRFRSATTAPRARGVPPMAVRGSRPRQMATASPQNGIRQTIVKRTVEQKPILQTKKRRLDVLTPDKDDDDCQVIYMQPKNSGGDLPQIENIQGGTSEPNESSIMHLSDSITLSVRNPSKETTTTSTKKSDAKTVANILATRGITVTATPKAKDNKEETPKVVPQLPQSINLNGSVSILPAAKSTTAAKAVTETTPVATVDLTDDALPTKPTTVGKSMGATRTTGLPYKCDLCPAQYPKAINLQTHRQSYHKTTNSMCDFGIPLINLKAPNVMQRLNTLGIYNFIPLSSPNAEGTFALPIVSARNPGNVAAMGATAMLTLGPVRTIPRANLNGSSSAKQK